MKEQKQIVVTTTSSACYLALPRVPAMGSIKVLGVTFRTVLSQNLLRRRHKRGKSVILVNRDGTIGPEECKRLFKMKFTKDTVIKPSGRACTVTFTR